MVTQPAQTAANPWKYGGWTGQNSAEPDRNQPEPSGVGAPLQTDRQQYNNTMRSMQLLDSIVSAGNMERAYKRVVANKGAPGGDQVEATTLREVLAGRWPTVKAGILSGTYTPSRLDGWKSTNPAAVSANWGFPPRQTG